MIEYETQLKIQSYLDNELSEREAGKVEALIANDRDAAALLNELRNTTQSLAGSETGIKLPESRDFFWSKIRRQIERVEAAPAEPDPVPFFASLKRLLVPAAAIALVAVVGVVALQSSSASIPIETAVADPGSFTYRDFSSGTTVVWLSYPADKELADNSGAASFE